MQSDRGSRRPFLSSSLIPIFAVLATALLCALACQPDREEIQAPDDVHPASGACCDPATGICVILTADACESLPGEHVYQGNGTTCLPNPCSQPHGDNYSASQQVSSTSQAEIRAQSGAAILVPKYAVPTLPNGDAGQTVFSIERDVSVTPVLPSGVSKISDIYRFGPEGFTFGEMVKLTLPYTGPMSGKMLALYRINELTGQSEPFGGVIDSVGKTISAQTYKLSPWYVGSADRPSTAYGAFQVTNLSGTHWLKLCVEEYTLKYPEADANFTGDANCAWAPTGTIGWNSSGNWYLPQGTYTFCVEMNTAGTLSSPPGPPSRTTIGPFTLDQAWTHDNPVTVPLPGFSGPQGGWEAQACGCVPVATVPVGTGQVQVTLVWHSTHAIDLDLWVTEPGGERCFYAHSTTATGGRLDRDNACGNYEDGRAENVFWATSPAGEYKVEVDWFSSCSGSSASMPFEVRVVNGASVRTYTMSCSADATVEVTRFTVASSGAMRAAGIDGTPGTPGGYGEGGPGVFFGEPIGTATPHAPRPPKD